MAQGTASLVIEVGFAIIFIFAFFMILAPMFNQVETITPDTSIDTGSPIYVDTPWYLNLSKDAPAFFMIIVVIAGYLYVMTHIGDQNV